MIELTVKTLDSQNHQFTVEDDMTVGQFKVHIAEKVNIPAATQRIIYCGRVLQDNDKLSDYDVNGKVVHLVQRAPPSTNQRNNQGGSSNSENTNHNRGAGGGGGFMGFDRVGNAVYLGSMAFGNEPSHIPQRATHNLSASRLNVARRMLRGAEHAINHLENPNETNDQSPPAEPSTEEEMTPVIEARVFVPNNADQPMDENAVLSAVENSLFRDSASTMQVDTSPDNTQNTPSVQNGDNSPDSTNEPTNPASRSTTQNSETNNSNNGNEGRNSRVRTARGPEMAELLTSLNQLQARFAPFLARYQSFLQDDPQVPTENVASTRRMLRLVSQTMHYLSHAYHSLSDIMINVEQPRPRLLMCRPILIQHSAMVHAGIPFQVEAQINVSADPPPNATNSTTNASTRATNSTPTTTPAGVTGQSQTRSIPTSIPNANINITQGPSTNMEFIGLPFMPAGGSMRVITTPIEIRAVRANGNNRPRAPNNNNNSAQATTQPTGTATPPSNDTPAEPDSQTPNQASPPQQGPQMTGPFDPNNSNMEFVVEVTPEVFRGAMNGPPPEFIQSLMQLVNSQIFNRPGQQQTTGQRTGTTPPGNTEATASQPAQAGGAATPGQNSQARGNTQTNPTTATHTRSTSRPHIQMTQQAVQGGFDPYLPCYSHHVVNHRHRLVHPASTTFTQETAPSGQQRSQQPRNAPTSTGGSTRETPTLQNLFGNLVNDPQNLDELMAVSRAAENLVAMLTNSAPNRQQQQNGNTGSEQPQQQPQPPAQSQPTRRSSEPNPASFFPPASFLSSMFRGNGGDMHIGITLEQLMSSLNQVDSHTPGESLFMDLAMLMLRNLRITDLFLLNSGNLAPLNRNRAAIQEFFRREVCQNDITNQGIQRATDRVIEDMRDVINGFNTVPTRNNIDLIRSVEALVRHHIPQIITMAVNLSNDDMRPVVEKLWTAIKEVLALVLHCANNGRQDLENVMVDIMRRSMTGIPADVQSWTTANSRVAMNAVIRNLNLLPSDVQQYIYYKNAEVAVSESQRNSSNREPTSTTATENLINGVEEMDVDSSDNSRTEANHIDLSLLEDTDTLPNVVFGSESWHRQTPEDWVPIITRDVYRQRRQNSQPPFSDAYLSGMPSKRRKLINGTKPQNSLPQVIKESLRQAVTSAGVASSTSPAIDTVVSAAGSSTEILTAYRNMLHSTVQNNLKENEEFNSEQFPNASSYFNKSFE